MILLLQVLQTSLRLEKRCVGAPLSSAMFTIISFPVWFSLYVISQSKQALQLVPARALDPWRWPRGSQLWVREWEHFSSLWAAVNFSEFFSFVVKMSEQDSPGKAYQRNAEEQFTMTEAVLLHRMWNPPYHYRALTGLCSWVKILYSKAWFPSDRSDRRKKIVAIFVVVWKPEIPFTQEESLS